MPKTLLIISAGIEATPGIRIAKEMGLHVVASDMNPEAPGFAVADDKLIASTYDPKATTFAARRYHTEVRPIDGVLSIAADVPLTVANVASALHLPGISLEAAQLAMDKLAMKRRFASDGVAIPWFRPVGSERELRGFVAERGQPLVLKPVDSRGSRGVLRLTAGADLAQSFELSRSHSPTGRVMVEEFLAGPQVSTESIVIDGRAFTPGFADRNYELLERWAPHFIENGGDLPSHLPATIQRAVRDLIDRAAHSLGIVNGVVKGDVVVRDGVPFIIEVAARLSGGFLCTHEIPLNTGVEFVKQAIRVALGEKPSPTELEPRYQRGVAQRLVFAQPGRITAISGIETAKAMEGVVEVIFRAQVGEQVERPTDSNSSLGAIIAVGETREVAVERAEAAVRAIKVRTETP